MRSKFISIYKDKVKRKKFLKTELKSIILKSIFQNFQSNEIIRLSAFKKITFLKKKSFISKQNNVCLLSGRFGGVYKWTDVSRHNMKMLSKYNMLHNTKIRSW
jgi:ribosomal protein S14